MRPRESTCRQAFICSIDAGMTLPPCATGFSQTPAQGIVRRQPPNARVRGNVPPPVRSTETPTGGVVSMPRARQVCGSSIGQSAEASVSRDHNRLCRSPLLQAQGLRRAETRPVQRQDHIGALDDAPRRSSISRLADGLPSRRVRMHAGPRQPDRSRRSPKTTSSGPNCALVVDPRDEAWPAPPAPARIECAREDIRPAAPARRPDGSRQSRATRVPAGHAALASRRCGCNRARGRDEAAVLRRT